MLDKWLTCDFTPAWLTLFAFVGWHACRQGAFKDLMLTMAPTLTYMQVTFITGASVGEELSASINNVSGGGARSLVTQFSVLFSCPSP